MKYKKDSVNSGVTKNKTKHEQQAINLEQLPHAGCSIQT
jgi:hypothetical protein